MYVKLKNLVFYFLLYVVVYKLGSGGAHLAFNYSTWEAEAGGSL